MIKNSNFSERGKVFYSPKGMFDILFFIFLAFIGCLIASAAMLTTNLFAYSKVRIDHKILSQELSQKGIVCQKTYEGNVKCKNSIGVIYTIVISNVSGLPIITTNMGLNSDKMRQEEVTAIFEDRELHNYIYSGSDFDGNAK